MMSKSQLITRAAKKQRQALELWAQVDAMPQAQSILEYHRAKRVVFQAEFATSTAVRYYELAAKAS
jgi:hypothetical protein